MIIKTKHKPRDREIRVKSGFAFLPLAISHTESVWMQRYKRHEVYYMNEWFLCDIELRKVEWPWKGHWVDFSDLSVDYPNQFRVVENPILPNKKKKVNRVKRVKDEIQENRLQRVG